MSSNNEKKVIEFIEKSSRPLIVIPKDSDGDTVGSALALFWALKKTGRIPKIVCPNKPSRKFSFLTGYDLIENEVVDEFTYEISFDVGEKGIENSYFASSEDKLKFYFKSKNCGLNKNSFHFEPQSFEYDSIFVIGAANLKSLGAIYSNNPSIFSNLPIVNIDYRGSNENFGNVNLIDSTCLSVSEIVAKVIEMSPFLKIDNEVAGLLLVGIIEKTDNLQSFRASSEIFYLTGYLLHLGAKRNEIVKYLNRKNAFLKYVSPISLLSSQNFFWSDSVRKNVWDSVFFTFAKIKQKILFVEARWIPAFAGMTKSGGISKLKLKRVLIMFLLAATTGILLFQIIKIEFFKDANSLELPQVSRGNYQELSIESEKTEGAEFSEIIFDNNKNNTDDNTDNNNIAVSNNSVAATVAINSATAKKNKTQEKELPKRLEIPKIGVSTEIQYVGLDSSGKMGVPSNDWSVAWYNLGTVPGKIGSAVIAGHLDSRTGKPAVFWNLNKLEIGDEVFVIDSSNNRKSFQVISVVKYETKTAPLEKIFGASDGAYLNLITCGGVWDKTKNNYTERFVVFTEYVS